MIQRKTAVEWVPVRPEIVLIAAQGIRLPGCVSRPETNFTLGHVITRIEFRIGASCLPEQVFRASDAAFDLTLIRLFSFAWLSFDKIERSDL